MNARANSADPSLPRLKRRQSGIRRIAVAGSLAAALLAGPALADPKVLVDSHIGNLGAEDPLAGAIVITGAGDPVKINSFTANGRCTVQFYSDDKMTLSSFTSAGIDMIVGLTDDQAPASILFASNTGATIKKVDLVLNGGDRIGVFLPALMPGAEMLGFPFGGTCGNHLVSLKADTDAGELDWKFSN